MKYSGHNISRAKNFDLFFLFVLTCCIYSSCSQKPSKNKKALLMVSIEPLRYFTEQIAGDIFQVESIVPDGYNPESYKPTPKQLMLLVDCQAFFKIGRLGFETTWLEKACKEQPGLKVIDTSDSIRTNANGMTLAEFDPHTWTSAKNAKLICRSICNALCQIDSTHSAFFKQNLDSIILCIEQTDKQIHQILADVPSRTFITVHPSLTYFAEDYGLRQLSIEKEGKEPAPADIKDLIRQSKEDGTPVILIQRQFSKTQAEIIAKETGAHIANINPLGYQWDKEMINIARIIHDGK